MMKIKINENKLRQLIRKQLKECLQSTNSQIVQISENKITKMIVDVAESVLTEDFNRLSTQDAEYMEAVESGDMEKAGAMVRAAFKAKFPNTKVVDENGEPLIMSHNTNYEDFYIFDKNRIGQGQGQSFNGPGFNFAKGNGCDIYGNRSIKSYLNAMKPLMSSSLTITKSEIRSIIFELNGRNENGDKIENSYGRSVNEAVATLYELGNDLDIYATIGMEYSGKKTDVIEVFEKRGYDSTIEYGDDGTISVGVVFEPNQIKSAEAVTYDNEGNVIPLSERFNKSRNDIRF